MWYVWERSEMHTKFKLENLKGRDHMGDTRHRWEDNINMDPKKIGCESVDWIHLPHDRTQWKAHVNTVTNLQVQQNAGNFFTRRATIGFL
jgi:hypothetical protein